MRDREIERSVSVREGERERERLAKTHINQLIKSVEVYTEG